MTSHIGPRSLPPPRFAGAPADPSAPPMTLRQRHYFMPPPDDDAAHERRLLLAEGRRRFSGSQRHMLKTMGWDLRVPAVTPRDRGSLSSPTPFLPDTFRVMGQQAIAVAAGMHGVHVAGSDDATLRALCKQRFSNLRSLEAVVLDDNVLKPLQRFTTPETRANAWAYLHAFAEGADNRPEALLPVMYYLTFFRSLAVAFAASGLMGLWRAQAYLSCCEGARGAAFVAFCGDQAMSLPPDARMPPPRGFARELRAAAFWEAGCDRTEVLRHTVQPPRPCEPPVPGLGPVGHLPIRL